MSYKERIFNLVREQLGLPRDYKLDEDTTPRFLHMSGLDTTFLYKEIEHTLKVRVPEHFNLRRLGDLVDYVRDTLEMPIRQLHQRPST